MRKKRKSVFWSAITTVLLYGILGMYSCASVQSPTGGPRDTIPPKIVKETPPNLSRNFSSKLVRIEFDEFIKLNNEYSEISISPALDILPEFKARKQNLEIKFDKPLDTNTTYTINFGKGIADVNETNILKNYTYVFATGNQIDSLSISGTVTNPLTREKVKDATVFILPVSQDSLFGKKRANFFTTTDTAGNFSLNNLREDRYRIYALNEPSGGDRVYNGQNEEIGFIDTPVTLNRDISGLQIKVFKGVPSTFQVTDRKIDTDGSIILAFNKPLNDPRVRFPDEPELDKAKTIEVSPGRDSILIWQQEITFDSLKVEVSDGSESLDTIILRRTRRDTYNRSVLISDNVSGTKLRPRTELRLTMSAPVNTAQQSLITVQEDSTQVRAFQLQKVVSSLRSYSLRYPWRTGKEYTIKFADGAFTDIYGNKSKMYLKRFSLDTEDNYGNITLKIKVPDTTKNYIIQWLGDKDAILRENTVNKDIVLNYTTYPTGKYTVRVIYDENKNDRWDTGDVRQFRQPEKTWTYEKNISLRPNWDLEENIIIPPPDPK